MRRPFRRRRRVAAPADLLEAIHAVTECPCEPHQLSLLQMTAEADELLFLVTDVDRPVVNGELRQVSAEDRVALATVEAGGGSMLLAFPDQASAIRHDPSAPFAGMSPAHAAAMVLADDAISGLLLSAADDGGAWAALARPALQAIVDADQRLR